MSRLHSPTQAQRKETKDEIPRPCYGQTGSQTVDGWTQGLGGRRRNMNDRPDKRGSGARPPAAQGERTLGRRGSALGAGAQVGGERVVLDGLVQHQGQQAGPVGHGRANVALLLKQLVQLVPLRGEQRPSAAALEPRSTGPRRIRTPAGRTYHAHALQVHLGTPQLLPAVMPVALALGQTAEVTRELENIPYEGAPAYLVGWHLWGSRGGWGKWQVRRSGKEREGRWGQREGRNAKKGCIRKGVSMGGGRERGWESLTLGSRECSGHSTWSRLQYVLL